MNDIKVYTPPIIIIGAHRSGTSMISRIVEELGVYMGERKDINSEALFFMNLNIWLLKQCGAGWENPENINYLYQNKELLDLNLDYLHRILNSPHIIQYLGVKKYLRYRSVFKLNFPWGWKDPRNTFLLPIWLKLFPEAKIIHVYRHGIDAANSLLNRYKKELEYSVQLHKKRKWLYLFAKKNGGFVNGVKCAELKTAFDIWYKYIFKSRYYVNQLNNNICEVKYEDFLEDPFTSIHNLSDYCNIKCDNSDVEKIACKLNSSRAYAYKVDRKLLDFSVDVQGKLREFGY